MRLGVRMVKGLANAHGASIVGARADRPFLSVDGLWRRAGVPSASFAQLAEADAFRPALGFARPEALWAIKRFGTNPPSLFSRRSRGRACVGHQRTTVALRPVSADSEVKFRCIVMVASA